MVYWGIYYVHQHRACISRTESLVRYKFDGVCQWVKAILFHSKAARYWRQTRLVTWYTRIEVRPLLGCSYYDRFVCRASARMIFGLDYVCGRFKIAIDGGIILERFTHYLPWPEDFIKNGRYCEASYLHWCCPEQAFEQVIVMHHMTSL